MTEPFDIIPAPIELPNLGAFLEVAAAIESADEKEFDRVRARQDPQAFWTSVSRSSGYATFSSHTPRGLCEQHTVLWLAPVVTLPGFSSVINRQPMRELSLQLQAWFSGWFGMDQRISILNLVAGFESFASQTPVGVRRLLEILAHQRAVQPLPYLASEGELAASCTTPRLGFIVGTASRYSRYPAIPDSDHHGAADLQQAVRAAMTFWSGNADAALGEDHMVGLPAAIGDAMQQGLRMWAQACKRGGCLDHWELRPDEDGALRLRTSWIDRAEMIDVVEPRRAPVIKSTALWFRPWQLGEGGLKDLTTAMMEEVGDPSTLPGDLSIDHPVS